jgi:hypothetical protein
LGACLSPDSASILAQHMVETDLFELSNDQLEDTNPDVPE